MSTIKKMMLMPIVVVFNIILNVSLMWLLTFFLAYVFDTTINSVACSPMIIIYVIGVVGIIASTIHILQYIDTKM
jgi:hypothetical protein